MAQPDLKRGKLVKSYSRDDPGQEYTTYHRAYRIGHRTLAEESLEPRDSLPEDSTIPIVSSRIGKIKGEASNVAIVVARKAVYAGGDAAITGTVTGVGTTVTATTAIFHPSIVGETITITATGAFVVATYTSSTVVVVVGDATCTAKAVSVPNPLAEFGRTKYYRGSKKSYWSVIRKFHCDPDDKDFCVAYNWESTYQFNASFATANVFAIEANPEDPMVLAKSLIIIEYRTAYNPKHYPIGIATQEMYTTGDMKTLLYDLADTPLAIDTKPGANGYYYAVETGSNVVPDPRVIYVIRTAFARGDLDYAALGSYAGKGNDGALSKIGGGIGTKQALCMKVAVAEDYIDDGSDAYVPVQFIFGLYDGSLDNYCTARQRRRWLKAEFVLHPDDDPDATDRYYLDEDGGKSAANTTTNAKKRIMMHDGWARNHADAETKTRTCMQYVSFAALDALLSWGP